MPNTVLRWLFAFLLGIPGSMLAQTHFPLPKLAKLEQKFAAQPNSANATALSYAYMEFAKATVLRKQPDSMHFFLSKSQQTWRQVRPQNAFAKAKYFADMGYFYYVFKREYAVADSFYQLANPWIFETDSTDFIVLTQLELANVYLLRGFKQKGADLVQAWEHKVDQVANKKMRSRSFDQLRRFYESIDNPGAAERAIHYFKRDLAIAQEIEGPNSPRLLAYYCQLETRYEQIGQLDSALLMLQLLEARLSEADIFRQVWILMVGASLHLKLKDLPTAKEYLNRTWPLVQANHLEETDDGQFVIFLLGQVAQLEGRLAEAEGYFKRALETCRKADYKEGKRDILGELVTVAEKQHKYHDQARYQKELSEIEVLLTKEAYSKTIAEIETEFKVLEKDRQIKAQQAAQRLLRLGLLLAGLVLGLIVWFYLRLNKQRRALAASNQLIDSQNKELTRLNETKSRFFTNISHEFRTPLTVILGMAEQLKNNASTAQNPAAAATGLSLIQRNGENLLRLINQILELSKLDSGLLQVNWQRGDIVAYLQYLTESFYSIAQERELRLVFYPEIPELDMDYDAEKMQAIVANLLSNALKFTPRGGKVVLHAKRIPASAAGAETPECLQLIVQDTGKGIPEAELPHIFDRFYQLDDSNTRRGEGTGIGLAYTQELVKIMGGTVSVESEVGKGSTFKLSLPVTRNARAADGRVHWSHPLPAPELPNPDTQGTNFNLQTILIIEDNADVAAYLRSLLQANYQIEWATDGQAGIECAFDRVPDIIISDVMMPEKDGYEVCLTLKNDERTSHIPIILLTAKATQADKLTGLRTGADAYLEKPFHQEELFLRLQQLVALRASLQARYANLAPRAPAPAEDHSGLSLDEIFLQKLHAAVLEKLDDPELGIAYLCQVARLSHTQVFRKLKALTGENPTQFIKRLRLGRALELLQTTRLNVSEVAYRVGFNDPNYFSRAFQKVYGKAPSEARN
ncbi:MAG: response regulator [Saprospiraceae bacterium]|nr:response regulator [Saprospiraceae bacterium]